MLLKQEGIWIGGGSSGGGGSGGGRCNREVFVPDWPKMPFCPEALPEWLCIIHSI